MAEINESLLLQFCRWRSQGINQLYRHQSASFTIVKSWAFLPEHFSSYFYLFPIVNQINNISYHF